MVEMKPAKPGLERQCSQVLVGADSAGRKPRVRHLLGPAEPLGRQPDHHAGNAAVTHQQVGTDTDRQHGDFFRQRGQKRRQVVLVDRLEHQFRRTAGAEPGHLRHVRIRRQPALDVAELARKRCQQLFAIDLKRLHALSPASGFSAWSSLGSWLAHCVIVPAPRQTT